MVTHATSQRYSQGWSYESEAKLASRLKEEEAISERERGRKDDIGARASAAEFAKIGMSCKKGKGDGGRVGRDASGLTH